MNISKETLIKYSNDTGFRSEILEKVNGAGVPITPFVIQVEDGL